MEMRAERSETRCWREKRQMMLLESKRNELICWIVVLIFLLWIVVYAKRDATNDFTAKEYVESKEYICVRKWPQQMKLHILYETA